MKAQYILSASEAAELMKSVSGYIKPGHKYYKRERQGNRWVYYYLEDVVGSKREDLEAKEAAGGGPGRYLKGNEDIYITELERKGRQSVESRVKVHVDTTAANYMEIKREIRKRGGWLNKDGVGTVDIDALRDMMDKDTAFARRIVMNEWAFTLIRRVIDDNLAELLDPELDRPDLGAAKAFNPTYNYELDPPKSLRLELINQGVAQKWGGIHPYQKAGINYLFTKKRCILGFDVGLGKTLTALAGCEKYFEDAAAKGTKAKPVLITCPDEVKLNWYDEMGQYFEGLNKDNVLVLGPGGATGQAELDRLVKSGELAKYKYVVAGYGWMGNPDSAEKLAHCQEWGPHIMDEAHRIKSSRSIVSNNYDYFFRDGKHLKDGAPTDTGTGPRTEYSWFLSATPLPNQVEEGFTMLQHLLGGDEASTKERKIRRLQEKMKKRPKGSMSQLMLEAQRDSMINEVREVFRDLAMIKTYGDDDVRATLPPIDTFLPKVGMNADQQKLYMLVVMKALDALKEITDEHEKVNKLANVMAQLTRLNQISIHPKLVFPAYSGRSAKMDWVATHVQEHLAMEKDGVVVMCEQIEALRLMKKQLVEENGIPEDQIVIVDQKLKGPAKHEVTQKFNRGEIKVLLGGKTAEEGINLQKGSHKLVHLDIPWVPKSLVQRNGRVARQGQKNPVQIICPLTLGTSDSHRLSLLYTKMVMNRDVLNIDNLDAIADKYIPGTDKNLSVKEVMALLRADAERQGLAEKIGVTYDVMGDEWKSKVKTPDGVEKEVFNYIDGSRTPVDSQEDLTKEFRDIKVPKQYADTFNYALHNLFKLTNEKAWREAIRMKRPRLTIHKAFPTIRDLIGEEGYGGYYKPTSNHIVVDTTNASALAHEMAHYLHGTHRSEAVIKGLKVELQHVVPEYFKRMEEKGGKWFEEYLNKPEEIYARMFEQMVSEQTVRQNPDFHPLVASSPEHYHNTFFYLTPDEFAKAEGVIRKYAVDKDGNPMFKGWELTKVPGQPVPGAEEAKPELAQSKRRAKRKLVMGAEPTAKSEHPKVRLFITRHG